MPKTITTHNGSVANRDHNIRNPKVTGKQSHILPELAHQNEMLHDEKPREAYKRIFGEALKEYNDKQTRPERKIKDYYTVVDKNAKMHPVYEILVQIGDCKDTGLNAPVERACLKEFYEGWKERNPNLECIGAYIHGDEYEGTLHMHIDYVPVAHGYTKGLSKQAGLVKAFGEMGFKKQGKRTAQIQWEARENLVLEKICLSHGIEVIHTMRNGEGRKHMDTPEYKAMMKEIEAEKALLQKELQEMAEEKANIEAEATSAWVESEELKEQIEVSRKELDSLQEQISEKQAENNSLDLEFWKNEAIRASDENKMLIDTVYELKSGTMTGEALQNEHIALIEQSRQLEQDIKALERTAGVIDNLEERTCRKKNDDEFDFDLTDFFVNKPKSPEEIVKDLKPELRPELGNPDSFRKVKERLKRMIEEIKKRLSAVQKRIQYLQKVAPVPEKTVRKTPQR